MLILGDLHNQINALSSGPEHCCYGSSIMGLKDGGVEGGEDKTI